jgi:hypothetical protein
LYAFGRRTDGAMRCVMGQVKEILFWWIGLISEKRCISGVSAVSGGWSRFFTDGGRRNAGGRGRRKFKKKDNLPDNQFYASAGTPSDHRATRMWILSSM